METIITKWARKCSATNEGMNEGYCVGNGEKYFKNEKDLIKYLREVVLEGDPHKDELSDEFILNEAYELEEYYWTEWEDEDDFQYIEVDGEVFELEDDSESYEVLYYTLLKRTKDLVKAIESNEEDMWDDALEGAVPCIIKEHCIIEPHNDETDECEEKSFEGILKELHNLKSLIPNTDNDE